VESRQRRIFGLLSGSNQNLRGLEPLETKGAAIFFGRDAEITQGLDLLRGLASKNSPRELAVRFTDTKGYFVSESSVYSLLKAHDLISSPVFIGMKAASASLDKTTAINQLWQTDFTYFKIIGSGWMCLSTVLDDFSRYIISWKLCTTLKTRDVTDTFNI
jgi:transposase InsO family protein